MKKVFYSVLIMFVFVFATQFASGQAIIDGAFKRTDIEQKKPMPLPMAREADVFWSKKVWRIIDLREKMNQPLYYPTIPLDNKKNLITLLMEGINTGKITPWDARNDNEEFKTPLTYDQVKQSFGAQAKTEKIVDIDTGESRDSLVQGEIRPNEIKQYIVKEEWYFDKGTSTLNVRIIGICPVREFVREGDQSGAVQRQKVFWVYFPEARELLSTSLVINPENDSRQMSFDDLFIKRYFNSYIVRESNPYNNRDISAYLTGKSTMLESKRIEEKMFNFEQDLWEY